MSHLKKNIHSFHAINDTNLKNIKSVLDQIEENTDSLEINTDGLEAPLTSIDNKTAKVSLLLVAVIRLILHLMK
jgi:hypothetical protein